MRRDPETGAVLVRGKVFTLGDVARGTGITRPHVTRIFNGKRNLTIRTGQRLAAFLGVPIEEVIQLLNVRQ